VQRALLESLARASMSLAESIVPPPNAAQRQLAGVKVITADAPTHPVSAVSYVSCPPVHAPLPL